MTDTARSKTRAFETWEVAVVMVRCPGCREVNVVEIGQDGTVTVVRGMQAGHAVFRPDEPPREAPP